MTNLTTYERYQKALVFLAARNLMKEIKSIQENENKLNLGEFE